MDRLSDQDIARFKARLLQRRRELEQLMSAVAHDSDPVALDQQAVGRLSRMDALQGQAMAQETERRRQAEVQRIDAALRRIEEGEYGYCIVSGDPIPRARLELDPSVATTVKHAG